MLSEIIPLSSLKLQTCSFRSISVIQLLKNYKTWYVREAAFRNIKTIAECLADELINAAKGSSNR